MPPNLFELARLLEQAAAALRQADADLVIVPRQLETPVASAAISARTRNALRDHGLVYMEQLCNVTARQILELRNVGQRSLTEIRQWLAERGLALLHEGPPKP